MAGDDVAFAGLAGQIELVRRGAVCARELVELSLSRIERIDPELNSFCAVYGGRALKQADEADARMAKGDFPPLLGIPIAVKDEYVSGSTPHTFSNSSSEPVRFLLVCSPGGWEHFFRAVAAGDEATIAAISERFGYAQLTADDAVLTDAA